MSDKKNPDLAAPETLPANPPVAPKTLGRFLNATTRHINQVADNLLAEHDLTLPQWVALSALWRTDGLMVRHLADFCGNGQPALSRLLDRMESKGLVERRHMPQDRRTVRVFLTSKGRALDHLLHKYEDFNAVMMQGLEPEEQTMLMALLERVLANGERHNGPDLSDKS